MRWPVAVTGWLVAAPFCSWQAVRAASLSVANYRTILYLAQAQQKGEPAEKSKVMGKDTLDMTR